MNLTSVEAAVNPANPITFLLDWELTLKCNLDCSYCPVGIHGGHDNSTRRPSLDICLDTVRFMLEYVDVYKNIKKSKNKQVILNVYGGESLHHPDILVILKELRNYHSPYRSKWNLVVTVTTNAVVTLKKFKQIAEYVDNFTLSYHTESTEKHKSQFLNNAQYLKEINKPFKCIVLMNPYEFDDAEKMIEWCTENNINHLPRQLDNVGTHNYNEKQIIWFNKLYNKKSFNASVELDTAQPVMHLQGRACCGGRQLCVNKDYKSRHFFINNRFPDWYCSVNEYFLFVKQVNGEIYTNKDCKMSFDGTVAPIGHLDNTAALLTYTKEHLANGTLPIIQCKKFDCVCGLCAPKAKDLDEYQSIMLKYRHEK